MYWELFFIYLNEKCLIGACIYFNQRHLSVQTIRIKFDDFTFLYIKFHLMSLRYSAFPGKPEIVFSTLVIVCVRFDAICSRSTLNTFRSLRRCCSIISQFSVSVWTERTAWRTKKVHTQGNILGNWSNILRLQQRWSQFSYMRIARKTIALQDLC